jgi:acyl carrier protein
MNHQQAMALIKSVLHDVAPEIDLETADPEAELHTELDLDSMDFLNIVAGIHDKTGIDIPERDYGRLVSLAGFSLYLAGLAPAV